AAAGAIAAAGAVTTVGIAAIGAVAAGCTPAAVSAGIAVGNRARTCVPAIAAAGAIAGPAAVTTDVADAADRVAADRRAQHGQRDHPRGRDVAHALVVKEVGEGQGVVRVGRVVPVVAPVGRLVVVLIAVVPVVGAVVDVAPHPRELVGGIARIAL